MAELDKVPEVLLGERGRIGDGIFGRDGPVGLDRNSEPIVVGTLAHAGLGDHEVGTPHRIVDGVDANQVDRQRAVRRVQLGLDIAAPLVDVQLHVD
ncbi:MAG TPA: hypothetical protein VF151_00060, partial [Gemmatimonadales bacterium]